MSSLVSRRRPLDSEGPTGHEGEVSKKRKIEIGDFNLDNYNDGNIIRIRLKNFVTYSQTEFVLSPTLNMIIGPNGTGKSTFVCSICLGLGGKPSLLGRAKYAADFIKEGENFCSIEITLKRSNSPNSVVLIRREMTRNSKNQSKEKSEWFINNKKQTESSVNSILKELNVQLDNLCCFLPQDKVSSFAQLTPKELLLETERAADPKLLEIHEQLIELDAARIDTAKEMESLNSSLERLTETQNRLQGDAEKFRKFLEKKEELNLHEKLVPYAIVSDLKKKTAYLKERKVYLAKKEAEFLKFSNPLTSEIEKIDKKLSKKRENVLAIRGSTDQLRRDIQKEINNRDSIAQDIERLNGKKHSLLTKSERARANIETLTSEVKQLTEDFEKIPPINETRLQSLRTQQKDASEKLDTLNPEIQEINSSLRTSKIRHDKLTAKIRELERGLHSNDRINILDTRQTKQFRMAKDAISHLRKIPELKGKVFEPPIVCLTIKDENYVKYFDFFVDNNTKLSFTAKSKEIYKEISNNQLKEYNVSFRVPGQSKKNPLSTDEVKKLGFDGYLLDFASGPSEVLKTIEESMYGVPVRLKDLSPAEFEVLQSKTDQHGNPLFTKICAGDTVYNVKKSLYGSRQVIWSSDRISTYKDYLFGSKGINESDKQSIAELKVRVREGLTSIEPLKAKMEELQTQKSSLRADYESYRADYTKLITNKKTLEALKNKLERKQKELDHLKSKPEKDVSVSVAKVDSQINDLMKRRITQTCEIIDISRKMAIKSSDYVDAQYKILDLINKNAAMTKLTSNLETFGARLHREVIAATQKYDEGRKSDEVKRLKAVTASYSAELRRKLGSLAEQYQNENQLTEVYLRTRIESIRNDIGSLEDASSSSIEKLQKIEQDIVETTNRISDLSETLESTEQNIAVYKPEWESKLDKLIASISKNFSEKFVAVASAGEVKLVKAESGLKDWRLELLVKFRDEHDLRVLDGVTESGGERAVSTIFYMLSLQGLTNSPFRVVDEINQGMDPKNERIVYKYMVESACQADDNGVYCQYFLITPKLLTHLYYHEKMTVHCIMANHEVENQF